LKLTATDDDFQVGDVVTMVGNHEAGNQHMWIIAQIDVLPRPSYGVSLEADMTSYTLRAAIGLNDKWHDNRRASELRHVDLTEMGMAYVKLGNLIREQARRRGVGSDDGSTGLVEGDV
jgi:hypothetical protein